MPELKHQNRDTQPQTRDVRALSTRASSSDSDVRLVTSARWKIVSSETRQPEIESLLSFDIRTCTYACAAAGCGGLPKVADREVKLRWGFCFQRQSPQGVEVTKPHRACCILGCGLNGGCRWPRSDHSRPNAATAACSTVLATPADESGSTRWHSQEKPSAITI